MPSRVLVFGCAFVLFGVAPAAEKPVSFLTEIAPVLKEYCFACHDARKKAGKYDLTTPEKLFAGGSNGEPITAGKPEESEFYTLIVSHETRRMPPKDKGEPVPKEKAALIERWIQQGAKLDAGLAMTADLGKELRARWVPPTPPDVYPYPVPVTALAFTPDGKSLVVGGYHELLVYAVPDGKLSKRIRTRAERTTAMTFLKGGLLAVAGGRPGQEGDVRLYDLSAPGPVLDGVNDPAVMIAQLLDADDSVLCLAASTDGTKLAAGGCDRVVRVWDVSNLSEPKLSQTIDSHTDWVFGVAFSPDGRYVLSASRDRTAKVWDTTAKESISTVTDHQATVYAVAAGRDGATGVSVGSDKTLRVWKFDRERGSNKEKAPKGADGHGDEVFRIVASPDGSQLATASADKTVRLWTADPLKAVRELTGLGDFAYAVAFSPDGKLVGGGAYNGEIHVWNSADGSAIASFNASPGFGKATSER